VVKYLSMITVYHGNSLEHLCQMNFFYKIKFPSIIEEVAGRGRKCNRFLLLRKYL